MSRNIFEIPLRYIHKVILSARNRTDAAKSLDVTQDKLTYLFLNLKDPDTGEYVTFEDMKNLWKNEEEGKAFWGDQYDKPVQEIKVSYDELNLFELYSYLEKYKITSMNAFSQHAHASVSNLKKYLAGFQVMINNENITLNFDILKGFKTEEQFKTAIGAIVYQKLLDDYKRQFTENVQYIVPPDYHHYELVQTPTTQTQQNLTTIAPLEPFENQRFRDIYRVILHSIDLIEAATYFDMAAEDFDKELKKLSYWQEDGNLYPLSYADIKELWPDLNSAQYFWQHSFHQTMGQLQREHQYVWEDWIASLDNNQSVEYYPTNNNVNLEETNIKKSNYTETPSPKFFSHKRQRSSTDESDEPKTKRPKVDNQSGDDPTHISEDEDYPNTYP